MDADTLRLWKQYNEEVIDPHNKIMHEMNMKMLEEDTKRMEEREKQRKLNEKEREEKTAELKRKLAEYEDLPWYKKLSVERPEIPLSLRYPDRYFPISGMSFILPYRKPSWEEFLDWCVKNNQDITTIKEEKPDDR